MLAGSFFEVLARFIRIFSIVACVFIIAGLIGLLTDEVQDTSSVQATRFTEQGAVSVAVDIEAPKPSQAVETIREKEHSSGREFIDDVNDVLLGPFTFLIKGSDGAVRHLLYAALGLLVYGLLLQMLADFMLKQSDASRRAARSAQAQKEADERRKSGQYSSPA